MIGIAKDAPSQADFRQDLNAEDQFGRAWSLTIEKATGDPTGQITQAGWDDPLHTPQKYLHIPRNKFGQPAMGQIAVDGAHWIQDIKADLTGWVQRLYACAQKFYPAGFDPRTIHEDPVVAQAAGAQPWPSVSVLQAAMNGHKGFLGLAPLTEADRKALNRQTVEDLLREAAERVGGIVTQEPVTVPAPGLETWQQFYARRAKDGLTMQQASLEWRTRKPAV